MDYLPNEILVTIFQYLDDAESLESIILIGNKRVVDVLLNLTRIQKVNSFINSSLAIQLHYLTDIVTDIKSDDSLRQLSYLPCLKNGTLTIHVYSLDELIEYSKLFIKNYCQTNILTNITGQRSHVVTRTMTNCNFTLLGTIDDWRVIIKAGTITCFKDVPPSFYPLDITRYSSLFDFYGQYNPITSFSTINICTYNLSAFEKDKVYLFTKKMCSYPEMKTIYFSGVRSLGMSRCLYNRTRHRISKISFKCPFLDVGNIKRSIRAVAWLPSELLKSLKLPILLFDVNIYINKYPNLKSIAIYHLNESIDELLMLSKMYPQLEKIHVYSKDALNLPKPFKVHEYI